MEKRGLKTLVSLAFVGMALAASSSSAQENKGAAPPGPIAPAILAADKSADEGNLDAALTALLREEPRISNASVGLRTSQDRALRVAAKIIARGDKPPFNGFPNDEEQRKWAYLQVRKLMTQSPDDAAIATDFAEIASTLPEARPEALKTLEDLDGRSAMASSFGYATLARIRDEAGSEAAAVVAAPLRALSAGKRQIALVRCRKMAKVAATCERGWHGSTGGPR